MPLCRSIPPRSVSVDVSVIPDRVQCLINCILICEEIRFRGLKRKKKKKSGKLLARYCYYRFCIISRAADCESRKRNRSMRQRAQCGISERATLSTRPPRFTLSEVINRGERVRWRQDGEFRRSHLSDRGGARRAREASRLVEFAIKKVDATEGDNLLPLPLRSRSPSFVIH